MVGCPSQHDTVHLRQLLAAFLQCRDAAVDDNGQLGQVRLQPVYPGIVQGRNLAILLRRQPL